MKSVSDYIDGRKAYFIVLILGMISSVVTFNIGQELVSAGIIVAAVVLMFFIKRKSDRPVLDERDIDLAEESTHQAVMWTGAFGGVLMIFISIGMGLGRWSYSDWIAPYYLSWSGIVTLAIGIEVLKRYKVIE